MQNHFLNKTPVSCTISSLIGRNYFTFSEPGPLLLPLYGVSSTTKETKTMILPTLEQSARNATGMCSQTPGAACEREVCDDIQLVHKLIAFSSWLQSGIPCLTRPINLEKSPPRNAWGGQEGNVLHQHVLNAWHNLWLTDYSLFFLSAQWCYPLTHKGDLLSRGHMV